MESEVCSSGQIFPNTEMGASNVHHLIMTVVR